jgi:aspartyl-tRNA(Asn)/glutamyl-tRNA(Gln) amidotransferase subunit A
LPHADFQALGLASLAELSRRLQAREISPVELVQIYLDRIAAIDGALHSFNCVMAETALRAAKLAEEAILGGRSPGPLHGIPIGIKDMIDVAGVPTTAQAVHRRDAVAKEDAGVVSALKRAGSIILGKQAMTEYAVGGTQIDHAWPPARNPWNLDLDPLSSSSGPAVAVAAGLCAGAVGTETAGSIRDPAAWCGIAGLKPTDGLVSTKGVLPIAPSMDCVGPMAWTVEDCALMLSGMVSSDPDDRACKGFRAPDLSTLHDGLEGLRVGVVRHFYEDDDHVDESVLKATVHSLDVLEKLGATLRTVRIGDFDEYCAIARRISWPEEYAAHRAELEAEPKRFTAVSRSRLEDGQAISAADYIQALQKRRQVIAELDELMRDIDVLVLPTMKKPAQVLGFEFTELGEIEVSLTRPFNLTGGPALALCNGFTDGGLPISLQIIGRHFEDGTVLRTGHALERALGLRSRRPTIALAARDGP